jgi:sodium-dependent dicarboxylate transporter 2/3/5
VKKTDELGGSKEYFRDQYKSMPRITREEVLSLVLFLTATVLSFARELYKGWLPGLKPAYVFVICAVLSFFITKKDGTRLMQWKTTSKRIVWDLIYVFAGGLALGTLINGSGAAKAIGALVASADMGSGFLLVLVIVTFTVLLSDVTSNTATAAVAMPIVVSIVSGIGENPVPYIYIAAIGVNLSYMLPTSIRAIPVGYGLQPKYMLKWGVPITVFTIALMTLMGWLLLTFWPTFGTV